MECQTVQNNEKNCLWGVEQLKRIVILFFKCIFERKTIIIYFCLLFKYEKNAWQQYST